MKFAATCLTTLRKLVALQGLNSQTAPTTWVGVFKSLESILRCLRWVLTFHWEIQLPRLGRFYSVNRNKWIGLDHGLAGGSKDWELDVWLYTIVKHNLAGATEATRISQQLIYIYDKQQPSKGPKLAYECKPQRKAARGFSSDIPCDACMGPLRA